MLYLDPAFAWDLSLTWNSGITLPFSLDTVVSVKVDKNLPYDDYHEASSAYLVSPPMLKLLQEMSSHAKAYHARIHCKGKTVNEEMFVVNFEKAYDCADPEKSVYDRWEDDNKPWRFRMLVLDPTKIPVDQHVFIFPRYLGRLVVSDVFKSEFEKRGLVGCEFYDFEGKSI